jgi:hypothetical protein
MILGFWKICGSPVLKEVQQFQRAFILTAISYDNLNITEGAADYPRLF